MNYLITGGSGLVGSAFNNNSIKLNSKELNLFDYSSSLDTIRLKMFIIYQLKTKEKKLELAQHLNQVPG